MSVRGALVACPLAAALALACASCAPSRSKAPRRAAAQSSSDSTRFDRGGALEKISTEALEELTNAYADRFRTLMQDAVATMVDGNPSARERAVANRLLVESSSSIYDIATNGDPFSQVLDMTIMVTLTSQVWIDDDRATRVFGDRSEPLVQALREARREIWDIAERVFLPDQLSALDFMIAAWRRENALVEDVSWVRFDDFAQARGESLVDEVERGGGLFEPLDKAVDQAKSYQLLIERIFYLAKRAPTLANWQSQAVIDDVLARQEVGDALANLDQVSDSVAALTETTTRLAADIPTIIEKERVAVFAELDRRQAAVDATLAEVATIATSAERAVADVRATVERVEPTLAAAERTLVTAEGTLGAVERLAETSERLLGKVAEMQGPPKEPDPSAPPAKPFDIAEYERALVQATAALAEANALLARGESLAASPSVKGLIDEVTAATEERIAGLESSLTRLVILAAALGAALLVLAFALAIVYRKSAATGRAGVTSA
ncbi:MAG: hypothetical protein RI967_2340 [Planctomycetota bacterium]